MKKANLIKVAFAIAAATTLLGTAQASEVKNPANEAKTRLVADNGSANLPLGVISRIPRG